MSALLNVRDLSVRIPQENDSITLVDSVTFRVESQETLGIVGESGSGKSTTGLALIRLTPPQSLPLTTGSAQFDNREILTMNDKELRALRGRSISMILQDPMTSLNPAFTIGQQIEEVFAIHFRSSKRERREQAIEALRRVRIPSPELRIDDYPHQLSGGMKQRVVGAIALACQPRLLIADEPTTSLDVTIQAQYLALLKELQRELKMAMIFITHDFGVVAAMCDRVCVLYAGQIIETGPVSTILSKPAHWYTAALVASVPRLNSKAERLVSISGSPPSVHERSGGCRFAERCPRVESKCSERAPPSMDVGLNHTAACWFPRS
jgi:oligopeptide/dipeptide ABC transporter ATP-binding protein